jgi:prepilin-type N-terminal cleavage/methylation domain-containing protein/prepilin-type processing-associated H-X9-DG protein
MRCAPRTRQICVRFAAALATSPARDGAWPKRAPACHGQTARGFTLVELLVVIAIIGILVSLLLPAVQAARESARRTQCISNLKQLATGCLHHDEARGGFPSAGWNWNWAGDPDRGFGKQQPGGWIYNLFPYIEQMTLRQMGAGQSLSAKAATLSQMSMVPLPILFCPTRRPAQAYPNPQYYAVNESPITTVASRSDYAGSNGTNHNYWWTGPSGSDPAITDAPGFAWPDQSGCDGPICCTTNVQPAQIRDGLSNTYLLGEKYLVPDHYLDGLEGTDNNPVYAGFDWDYMRWADSTPLQDTPGVSDFNPWGSAHSGTFNMAFCDGSIHSISYSIDPTIHLYLGGRSDQHVVDGSKY